MRSLHIDHGNPMNALLNTPFTQAMESIGKGMKKPERIVIISAHWLTKGDTLEIGTHPHPPMIYDMYGFPPELYEVQYRVNTDLGGALELSRTLEKNGIQNIFNEKRGIDHGIWSVLIHLFPDANIPIIPISVAYDRSPEFHFNLGQILAESSDNTTLFVSSGNIVHNLSMLDWQNSSTPNWAHEFAAGVEALCKNGHYDKVVYYTDIPGSAMAVPTPDHFLPFVSFMGASIGRPIESAYSGFEVGSISTQIYKNF